MCLDATGWSIVGSIATAVGAIATAAGVCFALFTSNREAVLSNKHRTFDRKIKAYMLIKDLLNLWGENRQHLRDDRTYYSSDLLIAYLTNCKQLEDMGRICFNIRNNEYKRLFLLKRDDIDKAAIEIEILWGGELGKTFSNFVCTYNKILSDIYGQVFCRDGFVARNEGQDIPELKTTFTKINEALKDNASRNKTSESITKADELYNKIINDKLEDKLLGTIKLENSR